MRFQLEINKKLVIKCLMNKVLHSWKGNFKNSFGENSSHFLRKWFETNLCYSIMTNAQESMPETDFLIVQLVQCSYYLCV